MTTERWLRTTLGRIAGGRQALRTGPFGHQLHASDYLPEGIPVVMPKDFAGGSIDGEAAARVSHRKAEELTSFRLRAGDVVLARRGEMGRCARVEASHDGWLCGTGVLRIRPNGDLDSRFLTHWLRAPETVSWLRDHAVGQTLLSLNVATVAELPLRLPSIEEQRKISDALSAAETAIASSRAVIEHSQALRRSLWRRLLTQGLPRCPDLGRLDPADWPRQRIGSLCTMSNGFPFKADDRSTTGLPIIRIRNLNGSEDFHYFAGPPTFGWTVEPGDLLFAWAGVKGSSFGPRLWQGPKGVLNQHIFRVQPNAGVAKEWLFETLKLATRAIEERARGFKCDLQHVRKSDVSEQLVPVPPIGVQRWIATLSRSLASIERAERLALDSLCRLKIGLSRDLLSGRVRATGWRASQA